MGILKQIVFFEVNAHKVDVKAESIPPDTPITKPSFLLEMQYWLSQSII